MRSSARSNSAKADTDTEALRAQAKELLAEAERVEVQKRQDAIAASGDRLTYKVREAAAILGIGERTLWALVKENCIDSITIGSSRRITRDALIAFIERRAAAS